MPVRCRKLCTSVSTAIMLAPTSGHSGLLLVSSRLASVIITTLSDTPYTWRSGPTSLSIIRFDQLSFDPAHQVAIGDISNKQEQAVRRLVQAAIAQQVLRQRTGQK